MINGMYTRLTPSLQRNSVINHYSVTYFGTSPRWLAELRGRGILPCMYYDLFASVNVSSF